MKERPRLRTLMTASIAVYTTVVALVVALHGHWVNERVESLIWMSALEGEMAFVENRLVSSPAIDWSTFKAFDWYDEKTGPAIPPQFQAMEQGLHDEIQVNGRLFVVLVKGDAGARKMLALDITEIERKEAQNALAMAASVVVLIVLLTLATAYGVDRLLRPLSRIADEVAALSPDGRAQPIATHQRDAHETHVIAEAINGFATRMGEHVERERQFISIASHELRTPITVLSGVNEVLLDHPETTLSTRQHLQRAQKVISDMEDLATVLLALARDPSRLAESAERVDMVGEIRAIVADHMHLMEGKQLEINVDLHAPLELVVPLPLARIALSNILRNAIENSSRGSIRIFSERDGQISMEDPGQGIPVAELSRIYTRLAREGRNSNGGIGIDLIQRISVHYGWTLDLQPRSSGGTRATLYFGARQLP